MLTCKKMIFPNNWLYLLPILLIMVSCNSNYITSHNSVAKSNTELEESNNSVKVGDKSITYNGVTFSYDESLRTIIIPEQTENSPLKKENDKPDSIFSSHVLFHFKGEYGEVFKNSFFSPELHIYPISEYRKQFSVSKKQLAAFDTKISELKKALAEKPLVIDKKVPFVEYVDASQVFHAHLRYTTFADGEGLWFLTQYDIEPSLINNQGLTYIFQGISKDNRYYISATFPVSLPLLPKSFETTKFENYELPLEFFSENKKQYSDNQEKYDRYISEIQTKLQNTPPQNFEPNLQYFQKIITSLKIKD